MHLSFLTPPPLCWEELWRGLEQNQRIFLKKKYRRHLDSLSLNVSFSSSSRLQQLVPSQLWKAQQNRVYLHHTLSFTGDNNLFASYAQFNQDRADLWLFVPKSRLSRPAPSRRGYITFRFCSPSRCNSLGGLTTERQQRKRRTSNISRHSFRTEAELCTFCPRGDVC